MTVRGWYVFLARLLIDIVGPGKCIRRWLNIDPASIFNMNAFIVNFITYPRESKTLIPIAISNANKAKTAL